MHVFQKPLGWVQRYFFNVEHGELPAPRLSLSIDHDWPLYVHVAIATYTTVAATDVSTDLLTCTQEQHALFYSLMATGVGATIPATDSVQLSLENVTPGQSYVPVRFSGFAAAVDNVPLIGAVMQGQAHPQMFGGDPQYIPPGASLRITHRSIAGGVSMSLKGAVLVRPKSYPLRLP